jgi:hypothetical protein
MYCSKVSYIALICPIPLENKFPKVLFLSTFSESLLVSFRHTLVPDVLVRVDAGADLDRSVEGGDGGERASLWDMVGGFTGTGRG